MPFLQKRKQPSMTGIAAGEVASARIPTRGTIYGLYLRLLTSAGAELTVAQMKAAIGNITLQFDGEQVREHSATFLLDHQKYYGDSINAGNVDGIIPIHFAPAHLANFAERAVYAIGTNNLAQMTIEANIVSVAALNSIEIWAEVTNEKRDVGQHIRIKKFPRNFGATGVQEITDLPKEGKTVAYRAMHIEEGAGQIDEVTIKVDDRDIYDELPSSLRNVDQNRQKRTNQYFH